MEEFLTENEGLPLLRGSSERCSASMSLEPVETPTTSASFFKEVNKTNISWHGITVINAKTGDKILDNISGMAESGQLIALMGSSGAGKTTLLNTLQCRNLQNLKVLGDVLVDGQNIGSEITNVSGYVQQDELFLSTLTVKEHLTIQARLRLVDVNEKEMEHRVEAVIHGLGLYTCQKSRIGVSTGGARISIGESRRLCFASELLDNPPLLFCDEPTTGLDSSMADSVINIMEDLCKDGRTIICTIHQPSSLIFRKFHKVMFIASGRVAYFGPPADAVGFFARFGYVCPKSYNPADFIIETLAIKSECEEASQVIIQDLCDSFCNSSEGGALLNEIEKCRSNFGKFPEPRRRPNFFTQLCALLHRSLLDNWRNKTLMRAKFFQKVIMGIFVGLLYLQSQHNLDKKKIGNINGGLFYIINELTFPTLFGILTFMPKEFPLLVREYHDGLYGVSSYFIARALSYMPLFSVDGLIMMSIAYWMVGLVPSFCNFIIALGIGLLVEQSAAAFGVMLSTLSPSYPIAISVAGPVLTCLTLTGGLYANSEELPAYISWVRHISWFRYGFEALAVNQWSGLAGAENQIAICSNGTRSYICVQSILDPFVFSEGRLWWDMCAMLGFIFVFYLLGFFGLLLRVLLSR